MNGGSEEAQQKGWLFLTSFILIRVIRTVGTWCGVPSCLPEQLHREDCREAEHFSPCLVNPPQCALVSPIPAANSSSGTTPRTKKSELWPVNPSATGIAHLQMPESLIFLIERTMAARGGDTGAKHTEEEGNGLRGSRMERIPVFAISKEALRDSRSQ